MTTTARIVIINEDKGRSKTYEVVDVSEEFAITQLLRTFIAAEPTVKQALEKAAELAAAALPIVKNLARTVNRSTGSASDHEHTHPPRDIRPLPTEEDLERISAEALARMDEDQVADDLFERAGGWSGDEEVELAYDERPHRPVDPPAPPHNPVG